MRAREFLSESKPILEVKMSPGQWDKTKYAQNLLDGLEADQPYSFEFPAGNKFTGIIQNPEVVMREVKRAMKTGFASAKIRVTVQVIDDETLEPTGELIDDVPLSQMFKDEKIKGELKPNMGNVSEALLGCAVAAKFASGGAMVTEKSLIEIGKQLAQNKGYVQTAAGKDTLVFKVSIPFLDKKIFYSWLGEDSRGKSLQDYSVPEETIQLIERRARAAVDYANKSKRVLSALQEAQDDPRNNKVDVLSDGGEKENQSTTKVDLKILVDGRETAKRLLSVKAGNVAQFGQVTGVNFSHAQDFFSGVGVTLPRSLSKYFYEIAPGSRNVEEEKSHNFENGFLVAFQSAFKQLKARAANDQAGLIEAVYQGLLHHLTRKEPGVEMVILDPDGKKAFRELSFGPEFEQALRQLQLVVTESDRANSYNISIYGFPVGSIAKKYVPGRKDADSKLVDLTSQYKDGSIRNMLGMGNLLKNLADIENHIEQVQAQQTQAPAPTTPAVQQQQPQPTQVQPTVKPQSKVKPQPMGLDPVDNSVV